MLTYLPLVLDCVLLVLYESEDLLIEKTVTFLLGIEQEKDLEHLVGLGLRLAKVFHVDAELA